MHDERQIRLGLGCKDAGWRESWVVDQNRVVVSLPFDGIGRIGDDDLKGFIVPVLGIDKGILMGDIELVVVNIMQEHIDPTKVIGSQIDFLAEKALADVILAKDFGCLQQQ